MTNKIPITIISGFLGSGKTTFLQNYININKNKNILYLINDFSANDVDGVLLSQDELSVKSIFGGSIFCNCLITTFSNTLDSILNSKIDYKKIIIETSGITNPFNAIKILEESGFRNKFEIKKIISIVDSVNFLKHEKVISNIHNQIKSANIVIINKTDLVGKNELREIKERIKIINKDAELLFSKFCKIDFDLLHNDYLEIKENISINNANIFSKFSIISRNNLDFEKFKIFVLKEKKSIIRVKGFMNIDDELHSISYSSSGFEAKKININVKSSLEFIFLKKENQVGKQIFKKIDFIKK